jgi:ATF/CREB family transcription factor
MRQTPQQQQAQQDPFGQHDANDAANGLFLLAQARDGSQSNNQFAMPAQPTHAHGLPPNISQETSPKVAKRAARNTSGSLGGSISAQRGISEMSGDMTDSGNEQAKPNTRAKGKKGSAGKGAQAANGRRKADDTPSKGPAAKKAKGNNNNVLMDTSMEGMESDDEINVKEEQYHENGKKMTDEEKRKNFLRGIGTLG